MPRSPGRGCRRNTSSRGRSTSRCGILRRGRPTNLSNGLCRIFAFRKTTRHTWDGLSSRTVELPPGVTEELAINLCVFGTHHGTKCFKSHATFVNSCPRNGLSPWLQISFACNYKFSSFEEICHFLTSEFRWAQTKCEIGYTLLTVDLRQSFQIST